MHPPTIEIDAERIGIELAIYPRQRVHCHDQLAGPHGSALALNAFEYETRGVREAVPSEQLLDGSWSPLLREASERHFRSPGGS